VPTALDNGERSPRKLRAVVAEPPAFVSNSSTATEGEMERAVKSSSR
jgi:hypothetical protein